MAKNYDIVRFQDSDGLTPQTVRKLNRNFERLLGISTQEALAPVRENSSKALTNSDIAMSEAATAQIAASNAQVAAASAQNDAAAAAVSASDALGSAQTAEAAATDAQTSLLAVQNAVEESAESARVARVNSEAAAADATRAATAAEAAESDAADAAASAASAVEDAQSAAEAATESQRQATISANWAAESRNQAETSAAYAEVSANAARTSLKELATVQDVAGTLEWITAHGTMAPTQDSQVDPTAVYFVEDSNGAYTVGNKTYSIVEDPVEENLSNYYELSIDESINNYVATHLASTTAGLWIIPEASGSARILVSTGTDPNYAAGTHLIGPDGNVIASFTGFGVDFADDKAFSIGNEDTYIFFDPSDGGSIVMSNNVQIGGAGTLSDLWESVEEIPIVTLSSTNGTVFKRNLGVSTTVIASIFTPAGRIDNATALHERYGAGSYLEWGWRDVVTDEESVLLTTDSRIGMDGFSLTVSPDDVDTQVVITCKLIA